MAQNRLFSKALWVRALLSLQLWQEQSWLCPLLGHRQVPVLLAHEGKLCSWNRDEAQVLMARVMVRTPRMLSTNPALA